MINITIDTRQLMQLQRSVAAVKKSLPRELSAVINDVGKRTKKSISMEIRKEVAITAGRLNKGIKHRRKATAASPSAVVGLDHEDRPGLQHHGAKKTKAGVSYKISKSGGRKTIPGAFMGLHGGVYIRTGGAKIKASKGSHQGRMREPIRKLNGLSAYASYKINELSDEEVERIEQDLQKQMERRIQFNIARAGGLNR